MNKNWPSTKDAGNLKFRNNESQLIVNCANNIQLLVYSEANYMN